jgi:hypothetical protein
MTGLNENLGKAKTCLPILIRGERPRHFPPGMDLPSGAASDTINETFKPANQAPTG